MLAPSFKQIVIFASGSGSNAQRLLEYFENHPHIRVAALFSNNPEAYALRRAANFKVPAHVFNREAFKNGTVLELVKSYNPQLIVLAGFLWLIPTDFVKAYPNQIINIHPALLPKYGGKGMHGQHVHQAVIQNNEKESGITIHYVNENYDEGAAIYQHRCPVESNDTPQELANRVLVLEHEYLPRIVEKLLIGEVNSKI